MHNKKIIGILNCRKELVTIIRTFGLNCVIYNEEETKAKFQNKESSNNKIKNISPKFLSERSTSNVIQTEEKYIETKNSIATSSPLSKATNTITSSSSMFHNSTVRSGQQVYAESKSLIILGIK